MRPLFASLVLLAGLLIASTANAQTIINRYSPVQGEITLAEGISIPKVQPGYTL